MKGNALSQVTCHSSCIWTSSFTDPGADVSVDGQTISILGQVENTFAGGQVAYATVRKILDLYSEMMEAMPCQKIDITFIDAESNESVLWHFVMENTGSAWESTVNEAEGDFLAGLAE